MRPAIRSNPIDDIPVLLPDRVQHARAMIRDALRSELGALIDWAPVGIPTPRESEHVSQAAFRTWVSALIYALLTHPKGAVDHGNH
jgi:hypothetical protein